MIALGRIAADFTLSKTKYAYAVKYGIAPWLKENLRKVISESPFHSVCYDDSLNKTDTVARAKNGSARTVLVQQN